MIKAKLMCWMIENTSVGFEDKRKGSFQKLGGTLEQSFYTYEKGELERYVLSEKRCLHIESIILYN